MKIRQAARKTDPEFEFEKEVTKAFEDFPQLQDNTVFLSRSGQPMVFHFHSEKVVKHPALEKLLDISEEWLESKQGSGSAYHKSLNSVIFDPDDAPLLGLRKADQAHSLDHEMGHVLVPGAKRGNILFRENAADAFAAIRHLQRFGNDPKLLLLLSAARSYEMADGGHTTHFTSPTINKIIEDSRRIDFQALSPAETIRAAEEYAKKFTPTPQEMKLAQKLFQAAPKPSAKKEFVEFMATTALASPDRFSFEIGMAVFRPFLDAKGASLGGENIRFSRKQRKNLRDEFVKRAAHFGMEGIAAEFSANKTDILSSALSAVRAFRITKRKSSQQPKI